jgi:excisionase family DNA binding protein
MAELPKVERTTLTMRETAEYLGISYWLVNQLVRRKQIPCARVGGRVLFRVQALDEYLKEKEENSIKK